MRVESIICNICKNKIPAIKKKDAFGIEHTYYDVGDLDSMKLSGKDLDYHFNVHICKSCAARINNEMLTKINHLLPTSKIIKSDKCFDK